jgi:hypothetical protein
MSYAATPIFFLMALVTYYQAPAMCTAPGEYGFLSSMWMMYVVMGVVHASPWLLLAWMPLKRAWVR